MGRRRAMPSRGKRNGRRAPEPPAPHADEFGHEIWPDDLPARDIRDDLEDLDGDEAAEADSRPAHPTPEGFVDVPAAGAEPQAEPAVGSESPDLFEGRPAEAPEPGPTHAAPRRPRRRKKVGTAVQLELWPDPEAGPRDTK